MEIFVTPSCPGSLAITQSRTIPRDNRSAPYPKPMSFLAYAAWHGAAAITGNCGEIVRLIDDQDSLFKGSIGPDGVGTISARGFSLSE
jgi:hypothetical protein